MKRVKLKRNTLSPKIKFKQIATLTLIFIRNDKIYVFHWS